MVGGGGGGGRGAGGGVRRGGTLTMYICERRYNKRRKSSGLSTYILEERLTQWLDSQI